MQVGYVEGLWKQGGLPGERGISRSSVRNYIWKWVILVRYIQ